MTMKNKYFFRFFFLFQLFILHASAQKTILSENFGGTYAHLESMATNSSGWSHSGTGDFVNKEVSASGALASNCFGQLTTSGASTASYDVQLNANQTYEFKAYVKTIQSRIHVTLRINVGGNDVATSGLTSANGSWQELSCSYTPTQNETATLKFVKNAGYQANIDKIKFNCTTCADQNYIFDFNDSKESFISGGGCNVSLGNNAMNINATGNNALIRSGSLTSNLNLNSSNYDRARVVFKTPFTPTGPAKLYFYTLSGGNSAQSIFNIPADFTNNSSFFIKPEQFLIFFLGSPP